MSNQTYLIFDYDGTLHNTAKIYVPAFRKAYEFLTSQGMVKDRTFTDEEISSWLGYSPKDMWTTFLPDLTWEQLRAPSAMITGELLQQIATGKARLFDGTLDVLQALVHDGYKLLYLSNCTHDYMEQHRKTFGLDRFFTAYYCTEDYDYAPKYEIFESIQKDYPGNYAVIGDRFHDIETAEKHGLPAIGCAYGYGSRDELAYASVIIDDIRQLPDALQALQKP